jgi:Cu/Ag efflux protein CusF
LELIRDLHDVPNFDTNGRDRPFQSYHPRRPAMHFSRSLLLAAAVVAAPLAVGQSPDHGAHRLAQAGTAASKDMAEGEVRKVDKDAGKITLKHGELKTLEMPPMTMVFQVREKSLLDKVKAGDKVRFSAEKVGGALTVTAIEPAK